MELNHISNFAEAIMNEEKDTSKLEEKIDAQLNRLGADLWYCSTCGECVEMDEFESCRQCGNPYLVN